MRILDNEILRIAEMELASLSELVNVAESILEKAVESDAQDLLARHEINASIRLYTLQHPLFDFSGYAGSMTILMDLEGRPLLYKVGDASPTV